MPDPGNIDRAAAARGEWGESRAASHLRRQGCRIVDRNWRSTHREVRGELDIVAVGPDGVLVFCEVKARRDDRHGGAAIAVGPAKQERIRRLAERWIAEHGWAGPGVRFDVIAIDGVRLRHLPAAF